MISQLGALAGVAIAGTIFINKIHSGIPKYAPQLTPTMVEMVVQSVAAIKELPEESRPGVLRAYREALG